jgi:hypothetical protein
VPYRILESWEVSALLAQFYSIVRSLADNKTGYCKVQQYIALSLTTILNRVPFAQSFTDRVLCHFENLKSKRCCTSSMAYSHPLPKNNHYREVSWILRFCKIDLNCRYGEGNGHQPSPHQPQHTGGDLFARALGAAVVIILTLFALSLAGVL